MEIHWYLSAEKKIAKQREREKKSDETGKKYK